MYSNSSGFPFSIKTVLLTVAFLIASVMFVGEWTRQDAQEILVSQSFGGTMSVYSQPGYHWTPFAKITPYSFRESYEFKAPIQFNDGGHATMIGSIQFEIPTDEKSILMLHSKYGSQASLKAQLVEKVVDKAIYMTGPMMSSRESYAERKGELLQDVEDQIKYGMYQTRQEDQEIIDPITNVKKTITVTRKILTDKNVPLRSEDPILTPFGIQTFNFTISKLDYNEAVEKQIQSQQQITMDVQTAVANAKKAEQNVLTATKQGEASAAEAKWKQEVIKAQAVTAAQQELEVAKLMTQKADQEKQAIVLKAEGQAEANKKIIASDGALDKKLEAYVKVNAAYAAAIGNYKGNWVPSTVFGTTGSGTGGGAQPLIDLLTAKTAKDMALDNTIAKPQEK
jgi:hypothetical protein